MESKKLELNKKDLKKILHGTAIAVSGALLTYAAETIPNIDFGSYTPMVVAFAGILINAGRKYLAGK